MYYSAEDLQAVIGRMRLPFEPMPLQREDAITAANVGRLGLFYEVGSGKTVVSTMAALLWSDSHTVVTCPPILMPQWESWLHSIGQKDVSIYAGPKRTLQMLAHRWVLMSHAIFRDSAADVLSYYKSRKMNLIVDEAQICKNPQSVFYRSMGKLILPDRKVLLLTATPTTKPQDTYAYMKVKTPTLYRSFGHWKNLHVEQEDIFGAITKYKNVELLAENFALQSVTRDKKELFGDNLDPIYQPMVYDLAPKHLKLYNRLAEEQLLLLENGDKIDATSAQRLRHALQQIVLGYPRFSGNPADKAAGLDLLDEVVEEVDPTDSSKSKLCIWTYYKTSSALVTQHLRDKFGDRAVVAAYGDTNSAKAVKAIMEDPECRILVAQPSSVGVGLNLQHVCSEMLFLEQATAPSATKQACGRVDRPGQKVRPTIRFAQAKGTIQISMFQDLIRNADLVYKVEGTRQSLRQEIFGR